MNSRTRLLSGTTLSLIGVVGMTGLLLSMTTPVDAGPPKDKHGGGGDGEPGGNDDGGAPALPPKIELFGVVRDFREHSVDAGHLDFEREPDAGYGLYCGNVAAELGEDQKPVFTGDGFKVTNQWTDQHGRPICYRLFDSSQGDIAGSQGVSDTGGIDSQESFDLWFRDVQGVNQSKVLGMTLVLQNDGSYVFDDKEDEKYMELDGFFPIEDDLFGNPGGSPDRNFHFTFELHTRFVYEADQEQIFQFVGDDDVWVYIDNKLVIDLGGVHWAHDQFVELDRLELEDGQTYNLDFFFAERHRTQSNFRIHTNINLMNVEIPSISAAFD